MGTRGRKSAAELATIQLVSPLPERTAPKLPKPPGHLSADMKAWWSRVVEDYQLEDHHVRLLQSACEAWDRMQQARVALAENGLVFIDASGSPKTRPEVAIERDSRIAFARLVRELDLDVDAPVESRPPALRSNRR
jgi:P27 family predicted phage terminase small subunit